MGIAIFVMKAALLITVGIIRLTALGIWAAGKLACKGIHAIVRAARSNKAMRPASA